MSVQEGGDRVLAVATAGHERDENGRLTRGGMESAIKAGESVLIPTAFDKEGIPIAHRQATKLEHLPTEAELAKGDPAKEEQAKAKLQAQIDDLQAQMAELQSQELEVTASDGRQIPVRRKPGRPRAGDAGAPGDHPPE